MSPLGWLKEVTAARAAHAWDYYWTNDEINAGVHAEVEILAMFVPVGELFQAFRGRRRLPTPLRVKSILER